MNILEAPKNVMSVKPKKLCIVNDRHPNLLNKRSELTNKCLHIRNWSLDKVKDR